MMNPFVYTFKTPNKSYFYDVNKEEIINVSEEIYLFLNKEKDISELSSDGCSTLDLLLSKGYLSEKRVKRFRDSRTDDIEFMIKNRACELVLQVTQMCNLCCSYCAFADNSHSVYQRKHNNITMQWETAQKSIDEFLDNSFESTDVHFGFYGGEPFIAFPLIKKCVKYIEENFVGKRIHFSITTNGTIMTDEIVEYVVKHKIHVMFSIDGPKHIHDINRSRKDGSGSFNDAFVNLEKLINSYGENYNEYVSINMVINPDNNLDEVVQLFYDDFIQAHDIKTSVSLASDDKRDKPFNKRNDFDKKMKYRSFLAMLDYLKIVDDLQITPVDKSFIEERLKGEYAFNRDKYELGDECVPVGPCVPGRRKVFVDVHGSYYPCERVSELLEDVKIGSASDGVNIDKCSEILNFSQKTEEICRNCVAFRHCGVCPAHLTVNSHYSYESKKTECEKSRKSFKNLMKYIAFKQEFEEEYRRELNF